MFRAPASLWAIAYLSLVGVAATVSALPDAPEPLVWLPWALTFPLSQVWLFYVSAGYGGGFDGEGPPPPYVDPGTATNILVANRLFLTLAVVQFILVWIVIHLERIDMTNCRLWQDVRRKWLWP